MSMNRKHLQGFTLVELVIVIVIIGILAAIAIPKFTGLSGDARASTIRGVVGAISSANIVVNSAAQIANQNGATGTVTACGTTVATVYGYASNLTALSGCLNLAPAADFTVAAGSISHAGAAASATCQVTYAAPAGAGLQPTYTLAVGDCS
jgi:MSHA pilin protein MshA